MGRTQGETRERGKGTVREGVKKKIAAGLKKDVGDGRISKTQASRWHSNNKKEMGQKDERAAGCGEPFFSVLLVDETSSLGEGDVRKAGMWMQQ